MRRVFFSDVSAAARALLAVPLEQRDGRCEDIFRCAELADRYVRKLGKLHPLWGNGTLADAARRHPLGIDPGFDDPEFCICMIKVLQEVSKRPRSVHL